MKIATPWGIWNARVGDPREFDEVIRVVAGSARANPDEEVSPGRFRCGPCGGDGWIECDSCDGTLEDCDECDGEGFLLREDCEGKGFYGEPAEPDENRAVSEEES